MRGPDGGVERYVLSSADTEEVATIQLRLTLHGVDGSAHLRGLAARTASRPEPAAGRRRLPRSPVLEVALQTRFGLYGTLYVFGSSGAVPFTADDRELLDYLVETTALGVDNASHLEELRCDGAAHGGHLRAGLAAAGDDARDQESGKAEPSGGEQSVHETSRRMELG